ncbi:hypothetical protein ADMFC3_27630 [Geovibrio sp. ADMFC3]
MQTYTLCDSTGKPLVVIQCEPEKKKDVVKGFRAFYGAALVVKPGNHLPESCN